MDYSVLMSVYINEKPNNLREAIDSMLHQTIAPSDFVIVCDGPLTEGLNAVLDEYTNAHPGLFQIIRLSENQHLGNALKEGLPLCRYNLVARMDSDDISLPDRMEKLLPLFENEKIAVVGGQIQEFSNSDPSVNTVRVVPLEHDDIVKMIKSRNPMNHVTTVFRKDYVAAVGSYIEIQRFEDFWLWARLILAGYELRNIDAVCVRVRTDGMFQRRKGDGFFNGAKQFWKLMYQSRLISYPRYLLNLIIWFFATKVVHGRLMSKIYQRFLRKQKASGTDRL